MMKFRYLCIVFICIMLLSGCVSSVPPSKSSKDCSKPDVCFGGRGGL